MDLRQIRYFAAVARSGSFTAASRILHISQPALGYQVKQLEEALKTDLLVRHSRGVVLTEAGSTFLGYAEQILSLVRSADEALNPYRERLVGDLVLGVTPTSGRALAADLLDICGADTGLRVTLREGLSTSLVAEVSAGTLDIALCYDPPRTERVQSEPLYRETLFLIGTPDVLLDDSDIPFDELARFALVLDHPTHVIRQLIDRTARERGVDLRIDREVEPISLKRELVLHHGRSTIVPYGLFRDDIVDGPLMARRIVAPALYRTLHLIVRRSLSDDIGRFILSSVRQLVAERIAAGEFGWESET